MEGHMLTRNAYSRPGRLPDRQQLLGGQSTRARSPESTAMGRTDADLGCLRSEYSDKN